jgi:hypothetical protein
MNLEQICLRILDIGSDMATHGKIGEGTELCQLTDKILLTLQAKEIEKELPVECLPERLRQSDADDVPSGTNSGVGANPGVSAGRVTKKDAETCSLTSAARSSSDAV